jgi:hypothetical protein
MKLIDTDHIKDSIWCDVVRSLMVCIDNQIDDPEHISWSLGIPQDRPDYIQDIILSTRWRKYENG